jgi:Fe-S oxidoreductase
MEPIMQSFVSSLRHNLTDEDVINMEACIDCKLCGDACAWYLGTNEETLHPTYKTNFVRQIYKRYMTLEGQVGGTFGLVPTPTVEDLRERMQYFWNCTACGRCTLSCPVGLSTRRLVRMARAAYSDSGLSKENPTLKSIVENLRDIGHSFGIEPAKIMSRYALFLCSEGIDMPVDVEGADILFVCPSAANTKIPDYATKVMKILNAANVSYTVSSKLVETGTEADHIVVHHDLTRRILEDWENEAERLKARQILVVECGCDTRTLYGDASEILGRPLKYPVIMFDPLINDLIKDGTLPVEKVDTSVTLHDPCHSTRLSGMADAIRDMLNSVSNNFVEMTPNREYNYCCNGGAGGMRLPENTDTRRKVSVFKANQIQNSGAEYVCSPCVVCVLTLEDICQSYNLAKQPGERMSIMLFEVIYDAMVKALLKRGELDRIRMPIAFAGQSDEYIANHSVAGKMYKLLQNKEIATRILVWLEQDDVVKRYAKVNPGVLEQLAKFKDMVNNENMEHCKPRQKPLTKPIMIKEVNGTQPEALPVDK